MTKEIPRKGGRYLLFLLENSIWHANLFSSQRRRFITFPAIFEKNKNKGEENECEMINKNVGHLLVLSEFCASIYTCKKNPTTTDFRHKNSAVVAYDDPKVDNDFVNRMSKRSNRYSMSSDIFVNGLCKKVNSHLSL